MADNRIVIRLDFEGLNKATQDVGELEREIRLLRAEQKKLEKDTDNLSGATVAQTKRYGELDSQIKVLRKDKSDLSRTIQKLDAGEKANTKTIEGLTKRNAQLTAQMRKLDLSTDAGKRQMKELRTEFVANDQKVRTFNESLGRHQHNVGNYEGAIKGAGMALGAMVAGVTAAIAAFNQINQMMSESIRLFGEQEKAERKLEFAAGDSAEALKEQARQIQANSTVGDEAIITQQAYLASLGFTEAQIKDMVQASVDLSAATGMSLDGAVRNLAKTYSGLTGELGESLPMLRDLTQEELRAGAATEAIRLQFAGTAAEISKTGIGALERMENAYGDLQERLGEKLLPIQLKLRQAQLRLFESLLNFSETGAAKNVIRFFQSLWSRIGQITEIFQPLRNIVVDFVVQIKDFANNLGIATSRSSLAQGVINVLKTAIKTALLPLIALTKGFIEFVKGINIAIQESEFLSTVFEKLGWVLKETVGAAISAIGSAFDGLTSKFDQTLDGLANLIAGAADMARAVGMGGLAGQLDTASNSLANYAENIRLAQQAEEDMDKFRAKRERKRDMDAAREQELHEHELRAIDERRAATEQKRKAIEGVGLELEKTTEIEKEATEQSIQGAEIQHDNAELYQKDTTETKRRIEEAANALSIFGMTNDQIFQKLLNDPDGITGYEKAVASLAASMNIANQAITTRFENQKQKIAETALAEKEAIEQSALSEEQKRIRIERAEQKKATEIEKIERKQAKAQKAQAIIQSIINTALAITKALPNPFLVGFAAATGAAQTALIAAQQFADGGQVADYGSGDGGVVGGANIPALSNGDNVLATVKSGEVILNNKQQRTLASMTNPDIFRAIGVPGFADGGIVPSFTNTSQATASRIESASASVAQSVQRIKVTNVVTETAGLAAQVNNIETEATLG